MHTLRARTRIAIAAFALVAPLALFFQYNVPPSADLGELRDRVPKTIGPWLMTSERDPSEKEIEILETRAILTRTYRSGTDREAELSVVYAPSNRRVAHPPEICYKGAGWSVEDTRLVHFPVGGRPFRANRLLLLRGEQRLIVLYWFKAGPSYYASYLKMQWATIWYQLTLRSSSSALIRVSAESPGPEADDEVTATLRDFAAAAVPAITPALP